MEDDEMEEEDKDSTDTCKTDKTISGAEDRVWRGMKGRESRLCQTDWCNQYGLLGRIHQDEVLQPSHQAHLH
jgi:hypothetical protein